MSWAENHSYLGRQFRLPSAQSSSAGLFLGVTTINDGASKNPSFKSSFLSPLFLLLGLHSAGVHPWKGGEDCGDVCGCFWVTVFEELNGFHQHESFHVVSNYQDEQTSCHTLRSRGRQFFKMFLNKCLGNSLMLQDHINSKSWTL